MWNYRRYDMKIMKSILLVSIILSLENLSTAFDPLLKQCQIFVQSFRQDYQGFAGCGDDERILAKKELHWTKHDRLRWENDIKLVG